MTDLTRYAVFGLFDQQTTCRVRALQHRLTERTGNGTVLFFPVHVTIRGRFLGSSADILPAFRRIGESITRDPGIIELRGPVFRQPDLTWLQIDPATAGYRELCWMHRAADRVLRPYIVRDEVSPHHAGDSYCPHVTLGWGSSEADVLALPTTQAPVAIVAQMLSLALVKYPKEWPVDEDLKIIAEAHLPVQPY